MEHKQDTASTVSTVSYDIIMVPAGPDPDAERLFILNEDERIATLIGAYKKRSWWSSVADGIDQPSLDELKHYRHHLASYRNTIDRYEQSMLDGLIPFRVSVINTGTVKDHQIAVRLRVHDGAIHLTKPLPRRPIRPDSPVQHVIAGETPHFQFASGFQRSNVRVSRTGIYAEFSELAAGQDADLVMQTLYLHLKPETRVTYELASRAIGETSGEVAL